MGGVDILVHMLDGSSGADRAVQAASAGDTEPLTIGGGG